MSNTKELTVDVRGSLCPKPVIETKKVSDANPSVIITTIVDNEVWQFAKMARIFILL